MEAVKAMKIVSLPWKNVSRAAHPRNQKLLQLRATAPMVNQKRKTQQQESLCSVVVDRIVSNAHQTTTAISALLMRLLCVVPTPSLFVQK
jgi:hypothetical protein